MFTLLSSASEGRTRYASCLLQEVFRNHDIACSRIYDEATRPAGILTERKTEDKYKSSYERIGKAILQYSSLPKMDVTNFFEMVLFSWLVGNNDMHLKNFSLYETAAGIRLTAAYDLLNAAIINPKDAEELALTLNGRKRKLRREDFTELAATLGIEKVVVERLINKYIRLLPKFEPVIQNSFLGEDLKEKYRALLKERLLRLTLL